MQVKPMTRVRTAEVTANGEGLVSHAGMGLLAELSDRTGLTAALSDALTGTRERHSAHDLGWVMRDGAVMLGDGGDCVTDLESLALGVQGKKALWTALKEVADQHPRWRRSISTR